MKKEKFRILCAVNSILEKDGKILLARRFQTGWQDGLYGVAAGHIDGDETMREALAREMHEEIGIKVDPNDLSHALTLHRWNPNREYIDVFFKCEKWEGEV